MTETRAKDYPPRSNANRGARKKGRDDRGGVGWEIVSEARACAECAARSAPIPLPQRADPLSQAEAA